MARFLSTIRSWLFGPSRRLKPGPPKPSPSGDAIDGVDGVLRDLHDEVLTHAESEITYPEEVRRAMGLLPPVTTRPTPSVDFLRDLPWSAVDAGPIRSFTGPPDVRTSRRSRVFDEPPQLTTRTTLGQRANVRPPRKGPPPKVRPDNWEW